MLDRKRALAIALVGIFLASLSHLEKTGYFAKKECALVARVIDGDTFVLSDGRRVRLLSINAPEKEEYYWAESKAALEKLVSGKEVCLERDVVPVDKYGRLLRYVYANGTFVNLYLVRNGFAKASFVPPNLKYMQAFIEAEAFAIENSLGMWRRKSEYYGCFKITGVKLEGRDEHVTLKNVCNFPIRMLNWLVEDEGKNLVRIRDDIIVPPNGNVTLYSSEPRSMEGGLLHRGKIVYLGNYPLWDNDGDLFVLRDPRNSLVIAERILQSS